MIFVMIIGHRNYSLKVRSIFCLILDCYSFETMVWCMLTYIHIYYIYTYYIHTYTYIYIYIYIHIYIYIYISCVLLFILCTFYFRDRSIDAKFGIFFIIGKYIVACYAFLVLMFSNDTKSNILDLRPCNGQYLLPKVLLMCSLSHYSVCQRDFSWKIIYRKFKT